MKLAVMSKLGAVAVYFFLTVLWNKVYFPGPYKALEKGITFLYFFDAGESMESMSVFTPRSSFYEIFRTFFKVERSLFIECSTRKWQGAFQPCFPPRRYA